MVTSLLVFSALEILPGNAAQVMLGETGTAESIAALEKKWGLDRPGVERYWQWVSGLAMGNSGMSTSYNEPTVSLISERLQVTLPLAVFAMVLTIAVSLVMGIYAASRHNRLGDVGVMTLSQIGLAVPNFWLAILLIFLFSVQLQWVNAGGFAGWSQEQGGGFWASISSLILPAIALAAVQAAILTRVTRSSILEVMGEDFVRTARAKGLTRRHVLWSHVLRNAMIPVLTVMGLQFGNLITSAVVIENVFVLPGIGRLVFQAIANRDLILVRDVVMFLAATVIIINVVIDVLYAVIDPRYKNSHAA